MIVVTSAALSDISKGRAEIDCRSYRHCEDFELLFQSKEDIRVASWSRRQEASQAIIVIQETNTDQNLLLT